MTGATRRPGGPPPLSAARLKHKVVELCAEANLLGDMISELAPHARDPVKALELAAEAHEIALHLVKPALFGKVFKEAKQ